MKIFWEEAPPNATFHAPFFSPPFTRIKTLPPPLPSPILVSSRTFLPNQNDWIETLHKTLQAINNKELTKVVMARKCIMECVNPIDPFAISATLKTKAQNSTIFCLANEDIAFLGATPEMLFARKGDEVTVEIVAGTLPRGSTKEEDLIFEQKLLHDPKLFAEWHSVQTFVKETLFPLCIGPLDMPPPKPRKTSHVQHLCSQSKGTLQKGITDFDLIQKLHPTPALCGAPRDAARQWIIDNEPFARGPYGSVIGWSTPEESMWIVAIRCCLIQGRNATLFTGAGIVQGSDPKEEWEELNHKMALYQNLFKEVS